MTCVLALGSGGLAIPSSAQAETASFHVATAAKTGLVRAAGPRGAEIFARRWPDYRMRFISPEGRVIDNANGGISHSEGQGYGMLLAVAAQDRETFDLLWKWTQSSLGGRADALSSWRWDPASKPNVTDINNASDGDMLIAWALGEAGIRWSEKSYTEAMRRITKAIFTSNVVPSRVGPVLLPGAVGFGATEQPDGPVVNMSYWIFPAIDRLQELDPANDWAGLRRSGLALMREAPAGPLKIPPEWLSIGLKRAVPAAKFERIFGYNAIRIPLYLAWSSRASAEHLRPFLMMWNQDVDLGPFVIEIDSGKARDALAAPGFRMIFALVQCIVSRKPVPAAIASGVNEHYYPATLGLLSTLAISERRPQCL